MVRYRKQSEIVNNLLDYLRTAQPELDTKPNSVARDLFVDGISAQIAQLYQELQRISTIQSIKQAVGKDLDRLASNYGQTRKSGSKAGGPALLCFNSLDTDISVNRGNIITARNGATFLIQSNLTISTVYANQYRATASKYRNDLDLANIQDVYAVEVLTEASTSGKQGNISKYTLINTSIPGITNVTNAVGFDGGSEAEDDATFKSRLISLFSGANTGTALGYREVVRADSAVLDSIVIEPGDDLMIRDGTQVYVAEDGTRTILSEGTGGKVDIYIFGSRLTEVIDSYIYIDKSNTTDPTTSINDRVLGQIIGDENKTVTKRRIDNLKTGTLPQQPINNIVQVSGSVSGSNFVEKSVDSLGRISGNYELLKDTGVYAGSPWGFDKLHWISDRIKDFPEDKTKGIFNGQDTLSFSDVLSVNLIQQKINVVNENSRIDKSDRSIITLSHKPVNNVTRVFNSTTGERYIVSNQNIDGSGSTNLTGRIKISGSSLPATSDTLQVDYTWLYNYDKYLDYDNKLTDDNPRIVQDSVDWGYSNSINREPGTLQSSGSYFIVNTIHPISVVLSVNTVQSENSSIILFNGRLAIQVSQTISNVLSIERTTDNAELWDTSDYNGSFSNYIIFLPTDTVAKYNDTITVYYNTVDIYNTTGAEGSFNNSTITISQQDGVSAGTIVEINYISNIYNLIPSTQLSNLPLLKNNNSFKTSLITSFGTQPTTHLYTIDGVIQQNLRKAGTNLALTVSGSISPGVFTILGTTIYSVIDSVFAISQNSLKINLGTALKNALGLKSTDLIPSNLKIAKISKVEKVSTTTNLDVLSSDFEYDIKGYKLFDNSFVKKDSVIDTSLSNIEFSLPETSENLNNIPQIGNKLRISFHYILTLDSENILFSRSGILYSQKRFMTIDSISISSGFTSASSQTATLSISNMNQPSTSLRYKVYYDYLAPKQNERITTRYNLNKLIGDCTIAIENSRPINADVLLKEDTTIYIDTEVNITVYSDYTNNKTIVQQNAQDILASTINANQLNTTLDQSDLVQALYQVAGVDRVVIVSFNKADVSGSVLSITANKNEHLQANNIVVNVMDR
jgi:hypothetical protein